ncbi:hypothetical protein SARC_16416, partial [Sphaeroforma arctica JP610]
NTSEKDRDNSVCSPRLSPSPRLPGAHSELSAFPALHGGVDNTLPPTHPHKLSDGKSYRYPHTHTHTLGHEAMLPQGHTHKTPQDTIQGHPETHPHAGAFANIGPSTPATTP